MIGFGGRAVGVEVDRLPAEKVGGLNGDEMPRIEDEVRGVEIEWAQTFESVFKRDVEFNEAIGDFFELTATLLADDRE